MWLGIAAGVAAAVAAAVGLNTLAQYQGWAVPRQSPEARTADLRPAMRLRLPDGGRPPYPAALLFSGCDGPRDNLELWAGALTEAGIAALIVDSHGPRGLNDLELWRLVCSGQLLTGAERAGDVAVAMAEARARPEIDGDRLALVGASHGGWAILDLLAFAGRGRVPHGLTRWPVDMGGGDLGGLRAAVAFYPYCGPGSRVSRWGWRAPVPVLFLLVEGDTIADETACLAVAGRAEARGLPVTVRMYRGVTHGFDQREKAALSMLSYDDATARAAVAEMTDFLSRALR